MATSKSGTVAWDNHIRGLVLKLNKEGLSTRKIASTVGKSKSSIARFLLKNKVGQRHRVVTCPSFSLHGVCVNLPICPTCPTKDWNCILNFRKQEFKTARHGQWSEYIFKYNDFSIHLTTKSVLIYPPEVKACTPDEARAILYGMVNEIMPKLESFLNIKLMPLKVNFFPVTKQHIALNQRQVHDYMKAAGINEIKDASGKVLLYLDNSKGQAHIESNDVKYGIDYISTFASMLTGDFQKQLQQAISKDVRNVFREELNKPEELNHETKSYIG
jgi:hypothetical protein